ncbi:MAG TPA: DUF2889 domain-containing protein, partial [Burkholderiaceae bacterium]|nr:DUF2889 domain-containing protein [Burkholderiaceae bacterium]
LSLRVTIDAGYTVVDAIAAGDSLPVPGACEGVHPDYRRLVGANLLRGFRREVKARMGGTRGCTHLSELAGVLPTAALQSVPHLLQPRHDPSSPEPPFFIGQCHAYDRSGETVKRHYPQWFVQAD